MYVNDKQLKFLDFFFICLISYSSRCYSGYKNL